MAFFLILGGILAGSLIWWVWADKRLRPYRWLRVLVGAYVALQLLYLASHFLVPSIARQWHRWLPVGAIAAAYIWHMLVVPLWLIALALYGLTPMRRRGSPGVESRRRFLGACAAVAPTVITGAGAFLAVSRLYDFRLRRLDLAIPGLPPGLEGTTIAHVTDFHVGKFSRPETLTRIVDTVNGLEADLVLVTGDLIDLSLTDLDEGIDVVKRLDPRGGLFMCEGNHDLIDDGAEFRRRVTGSGIPLLLDRADTVLVRDEPVQVSGLRWSRSEEQTLGSLRVLRDSRDEDAFRILLAHHPHAFDSAIDFPLTLSGHTHGGLLNLSESVGAGPLLYRYWSGPYTRGDRTVVVSNGVGTWFPVRLHAPAEVVHLTLRRSAV